MDNQLLAFLNRKPAPRIVVIGDALLDRYAWGRVKEVSEEAPVPVVGVEREELQPAGAGLVAAMLAALGARVSLIACKGRDDDGDRLEECLSKAGVEFLPLKASPSATARRMRVFGYVHYAGRGVQQVVSLIHLPKPAELAEARKELIERIDELLAGCDLLVMQDSGHGLLSGDAPREIISAATKRNVGVVCDPEATGNPDRFRGAGAWVVNRFEAEKFTGMAMADPAHYSAAAKWLRETYGLNAVYVKLDREGMYLDSSREGSELVPTVQREVADVTGAGDEALAATAFVTAAGGSDNLAAHVANFAASLEVTRLGGVPLTREEIVREVLSRQAQHSAKVVTREEAVAIRERVRREGKTVAFTNGCFDLLHIGHISLIRFARRQGDVLMVGINSDASTRRLKGEGRPVNDQATRAGVLAALEDLDYVFVFDETSVLDSLKLIKPDVLVKGGDYDKEGVVGWREIEACGGRVVLAPLVQDKSTTATVRKILNSGTAESK
ncbi:MAG TPA: PfkB family carbohydrate kinase [Candidatus Brocadiia bacterium]|nr:PfkB family carbohydrate kinase [Candidatus Brocadiia bacterium]